MKKDSYQMPRPELGDVVLFYSSGRINNDPAPALVTLIGERSLTLNVFNPRSVMFALRDAVHHASDPLLENPHRREQGCWTYRPCDIARKEAELELLTAPEKIAA